MSETPETLREKARAYREDAKAARDKGLDSAADRLDLWAIECEEQATELENKEK